MPRKAEAAERLMLLINRRVRRVGGWNCAIIMASISLAHRRSREPTIQSLIEETGLSAGVVHRLLQKLSVAGLIETGRLSGKFSRKLTARGGGKLRRICRL